MGTLLPPGTPSARGNYWRGGEGVKRAGEGSGLHGGNGGEPDLLIPLLKPLTGLLLPPPPPLQHSHAHSSPFHLPPYIKTCPCPHFKAASDRRKRQFTAELLNLHAWAFECLPAGVGWEFGSLQCGMKFVRVCIIFCVCFYVCLEY